MESNLSNNLENLQGVGADLQTKLAKLGINRIADLLFHFPFRYLNKTKLLQLEDLQNGTIEHEVLIDGIIQSARVTFGRKKILRVLLLSPHLNNARVNLVFFNFNSYQAKALQKGSLMRCFGKLKTNIFFKTKFNNITLDENRIKLTLQHPSYQLFSGNFPPLDKKLTPVYPTTQGVGQITLLKLIKQALVLLTKQSIPNLFANLMQEQGQKWQDRLGLEICDINIAIRSLHFPNDNVCLDEFLDFRSKFHKSLIFEELLAQQLAFLRNRSLQESGQYSKLRINQKFRYCLQEFYNNLDFTLTDAQNKVINEILEDVKQDKLIQRLVQGDVGSGKTVVAIVLSILAFCNGQQVAIMAPTEILAEQHFLTFNKLLQPIIKLSELDSDNSKNNNHLSDEGLFSIDNFDNYIVCLNSKVKEKRKKEILQYIASKQAKIVIGTHSLLQDKVDFANLGLIIIDEQHKFGVEQRRLLKSKIKKMTHYSKQTNNEVHTVYLSATPIPRTLAMSLYGDLDVSIIDQKPANRKEVITKVISKHKREKLIQRLLQMCLSGKQAYWVCPLISESEVLSVKAAEEVFKELEQKLPEIKIGLVHSNLKAIKKEEIVTGFRNNQISLLVSTTVIEVGVDVPNSQIMIIENPERLGLSQLHQLRGRVGRGDEQAYCLLLAGDELSDNAQKRLSILTQTNDGFKIAEADLKIRGAGNILGVEQSGAVSFKVANFGRDFEYIKPLRTLAIHLSAIAKNNHSTRKIITALISRWFFQAEEYYKS